ncbi:hypothetical protein [Rhizobium sp. Rhizsp42]|uniref:hypothetical protein n=1 Tax=Rhizobium sp. Rhizsp42 TaxID=3243034 RepID=UPI0039AF94B5
MANIVIDLSKSRRIVVRPPTSEEAFADGPHFLRPEADHYWVRTPFGNLLYAVGPEQFGALLAMLGAIEFELNGELRTLLNSILRYEIVGFTIEIAFESAFVSGLVSPPTGDTMDRAYDASALLDQIAQAASPKLGF